MPIGLQIIGPRYKNNGVEKNTINCYKLYQIFTKFHINLQFIAPVYSIAYNVSIFPDYYLALKFGIYESSKELLMIVIRAGL